MDSGVRIHAFNLGFFEGIIPTFGLWCGPGYSAGQRGTPFDLSFTGVAKVPDVDGNLIDSKLDLICQNHDRTYLAASGMPDEARLKAEADSTFLRDLQQAYESLTPSEQPYAFQAYAAFSLKTVVVNIPSVVANYAGVGLSNTMKFFKENATQKNPFVQLAGENAEQSILVDSEGNIVLGYSKEQESTTIKIETDQEKIEIFKQELDGSGEVNSELKIQINLNSSVSELTYLNDGVAEINGVIIGPLTQEKLDEFSELGRLALELPSMPDASSPEEVPDDFASWQYRRCGARRGLETPDRLRIGRGRADRRKPVDVFDGRVPDSLVRMQ